jgi:hypothetical protein
MRFYKGAIEKEQPALWARKKDKVQSKKFDGDKSNRKKYNNEY